MVAPRCHFKRGFFMKTVIVLLASVLLMGQVHADGIKRS